MDYLIINNLLKSKRGYTIIHEEDCRELIRKAVAIWGNSILPVDVRRNVERIGTLNYLNSKNKPHYRTIIAKAISMRDKSYPQKKLPVKKRVV